MNNSLMIYLNKRLHQNDPKFMAARTRPGPVVCISRDVGCGGLAFAKLLAEELDKLTFCKKWKVISKEILLESASELDMAPDKLKTYLKDGDRTLFDDVLAAFREKRYKSDRRITKTLIDLISSFANDGYSIIVGRAGHIIARNIDRSLLVKLSAPFEWRLSKIMEKNNLNLRQATDFMEKTEKERENIRRHIAGSDSVADEFDITLDISRLDSSMAVQLIVYAAQLKGLLEPHKSKVEVF